MSLTRNSTLLEPEARPVQQRHDQPHHTLHVLHELPDFFSTEYDGQLVRHPCPWRVLDRAEIKAQHLAVQEHQRA
jgi:hypothetical protein